MLGGRVMRSESDVVLLTFLSHLSDLFGAEVTYEV